LEEGNGRLEWYIFLRSERLIYKKGK